MHDIGLDACSPYLGLDSFLGPVNPKGLGYYNKGIDELVTYGKLMLLFIVYSHFESE